MNKVGKSVCTNPHRSAAHSVYRSIHYIISNVKYHFGYRCRNRSIARRLTNTTSATKTSTSSSQKVVDERKTAAKKVLLDFFITWYSRWENVEWLSVKILFLFLFRTQGLPRQPKNSRNAFGYCCCCRCRVLHFYFILFSLSKIYIVLYTFMRKYEKKFHKFSSHKKLWQHMDDGWRTEGK